MERKILLFGFTELPAILAAAAAAGPFGAEVTPVAPGDCGLTIGELAEGKTGGAAPAVLPGRMAVLCGVEDCLDGLLPALRQAGLVCPKAVMTAHNRTWKPERLLTELLREQDAIRRQQR